MAQISRVNQKVFGDTGATGEFGKIGSDATGTPVTTKDLETMQELSQYSGGLYDITADLSEPPRGQDINALYYMMTTQLRYLMQAGVPEWHTDAEYYAGASFVQGSDGNIYQALTGDDTTPNTGNDPTTDTTNWVALGLGVGQTWNSVTSSRVAGTTYTNTLDKPIEVIITINAATNSVIYCSGVLIAAPATVGLTSAKMSTSFIVPAGASYYMTIFAGSIATWVELY